MAVTGKTGADSIFSAQKRQCLVLTKYHARFVAVVAAALAAGAITSSEAAVITAWIGVAQTTCDALKKLADYSGF